MIIFYILIWVIALSISGFVFIKEHKKTKEKIYHPNNKPGIREEETKEQIKKVKNEKKQLSSEQALAYVNENKLKIIKYGEKEFAFVSMDNVEKAKENLTIDGKKPIQTQNKEQEEQTSSEAPPVNLDRFYKPK